MRTRTCVVVAFLIAASSELAAKTINIGAGVDVSPTLNNYRAIVDGLATAVSGDTIILSGSFTFTAPFAQAAWALGNDGIASTADDYSVLIPANLNNITFTGSTTPSPTIIQGPGDLSSVNLEAFLVFDGGDNQDWTISNLNIYGFDLAIGFFSGAGGSDAYNGTHVENVTIIIPADLNATVAPVDVNQNIGIHYSFGTNQSFLNNTIFIEGDGVSNSAGSQFSSSVGMQSNTSGGAVYDGLIISGNQIHVLDAQSADPANIFGIWENGLAHTSDIEVSNNEFENDAAGNDPQLNMQRAFRVTSHSSPTTTVAYSGNSVNGANIGFVWLGGSNFAGNQPVRLVGNTITSCNTGVVVQSNGIAHLAQNEITLSGAAGVRVITGSLAAPVGVSDAVLQNSIITGSGDGILLEAGAGAIGTISQNNLGENTGLAVNNLSAGAITAEKNWWGSNLVGPVGAEASGNVDVTPWLASGTDTFPAVVGFQAFPNATTAGTLTTFTGTTSADSGSFTSGGLVTFMLNGQSATLPGVQLLSLSVLLLGSNDTFTMGATSVPTTFDGGTGDDTLIGPNATTTWNIITAGAGNAPAVTSFTSVESLRGGTGNDSFVFGASGSLSQTINGDLGSDSLDNTAIAGSSRSAAPPGSLDGFFGTATGVGAGFDNINSVIVPPPIVTATMQTPTQVQVTWPLVSGANGYQVFRRYSGVSDFVLVSSPGPNSYTDTNVSAGTTYAYRVQSVGPGSVSGASNTDLATTLTYTNEPLVPGLVVKAVDLTETRTAVNAVRAAAGLGPFDFGGPLTLILANHIAQPRSALDEALTALGIATGGYTDPSLPGVVVKAVHTQEIRNRTK